MSPAKLQSSVQNWFSFLGDVPKNQWIWLITAGITLSMVAVGFLGIQRPWQQQRRALQAQYDQEQEKTKLLSSINSKSSQLDKRKELLLLKGGTPILVSEVTRLASKTSLGIDSVIPQPETNFGPFTRLQIDVEATATFPNLLDFLNSMEQHEPLLKIDRMELSKLDSENIVPRAGSDKMPAAGPDRHKISLSISAFSKQGVSP